MQDLTIKTKKQESRQRELEGSKATTERRLGVVSNTIGDMQLRKDQIRSLDLNKQSKDLTEKNYEKQAEVDELLNKVQS